MKVYTHFISVPFTGSLNAVVESDEKSPTNRKVYKLFCEKYELDQLTITTAGEDDIDIEEWPTHEEVVRGNYFFGVSGSIEIVETKEYLEDEEG